MGKAKTQKGKGTKSKPPKGVNGRAVTPPPDPAPDVLTLEETAAWLRVSAEGLRADAERGAVPARHVGGEWRFSRRGVVGWLSSPPAAPAPNGPRRKLADLPLPDLPVEEYEAFRARLEASRDEVDRLTKSGKYAEDE